MKKIPQFPTETALCAAFIAWAKPQGWIAYPETADWDILMVHADGTQIGIQAKLKFNLMVLHQAITTNNPRWHDEGPDFRAILIPEQSGYTELTAHLGLIEIFARRDYFRPAVHDFEPKLGDLDRYHGWHYCNPAKRVALPEYVPDVPAGVPAPSTLSHWKIAALHIIATLEIRGWVTRLDFSSNHINPGIWLYGSKWLKPGEAKGQWIADESMPDFKSQHPTVYPQIVEKLRKTLL